MICIAHRGASGTEPENTLQAFRRALEVGAHGIELDVRTREGELLVFHDGRLDRTTNGLGAFARKSLAELRALATANGEPIPTLREVTTLVARRAFINIELKGRGTAVLVAAHVRELVEREGWRPEQFLVSSFIRGELRAFRRADGGRTPIGLLLTRPTRFFLRSARLLGAAAVHPPLRYTTRKLVEKAHARGLKVFVYTVNKPESLARMEELGVDGVFTDFPERMFQLA